MIFQPGETLLDKFSTEFQYNPLYNKYKCYLLCDQEWNYMINLDDVLIDIGCQKKHAIKELTKHFKENVGYIVQKTENKVFYFISTQTFKDLCIYVNTNQSLLLRDVMLELENIIIQSCIQYINYMEHRLENNEQELDLLKTQHTQSEIVGAGYKYDLDHLLKVPNYKNGTQDAIFIIRNTTNNTVYFETTKTYIQTDDTMIVYTKSCYNMYLLKSLLNHHLVLSFGTIILKDEYFQKIKDLLDLQQFTIDGENGKSLLHWDMSDISLHNNNIITEETEYTQSEEYEKILPRFKTFIKDLKTKLISLCKQ
jgi:hypothetical protein